MSEKLNNVDLVFLAWVGLVVVGLTIFYGIAELKKWRRNAG